MRYWRAIVWTLFAGVLAPGVGCGDDSGESAGSTTTSSGTGGGASAVARGEYIVNVLGGCVDCHDAKTGPKYFLSGVECLVDTDYVDTAVGCLSSANLTNHETGLMNRSDSEIKKMFRTGVRPAGDPLHGYMPYWIYGNMSDEDANAVVAYLRTVKGVDHEVPAMQEPWKSDLAKPSLTVLDPSKIPEPTPTYADVEAARRGRYLTSMVALCITCHTPKTASGIDLTKAFQGGQTFNGMNGQVDSANLTPHDPTGLGGWTVDDVVKALVEGIDKQGDGLCGPMPAGPDGYLADLAPNDASDIANYLLSLPPKEGAIVHECKAPPQ